MHVSLSIERLVIDTQAERAEADRVPAVLKEAFEKLAAKLSGLPSEQRAQREQALASLQVELGSVQELLGPRGADRLAEELYRQLTRRIA